MKILVITIAFPPSSHANAKRPYYLVKGFLDAGWDVDVVTSHLDRINGTDEILEHPRLHISCVADPLERVRSRFAPSGRIFRILSLISQGLVWPDGYALWAFRVFLNLRRTNKDYDKVLAFVFPPSIYLASWFSGMIGRHWTFDLQESVTPQFALMPKRSPLHKLLASRLVKLERRALHKAGRVVFTAATNRLAYIREGLAQEESTHHVPYFYDCAAFQTVTPIVTTTFHIVYFGTFDWHGCRSPETFLRAFSCFLEKYPEARSKARFIFYGNWQSIHDQIVENLKLRDYVVINRSVPYAEYLERLKSSPILLLIVSPSHNLFMPSKIVDYFGSRRPILAFVPNESEMRQVLEKAGMTNFASHVNDVAGGTRAIEELWRRYQTGQPWLENQKTEEWSSVTQITRYLKIVSSDQ